MLSSMKPERIQLFGEGDAPQKPIETLGAKGAGLDEMARLGLPIPPGFVIPTSAYHLVTSDEAGSIPESLKLEIDDALRRLEEASGKRFGAAENPLLVSVRSGAAISMPGMLDTILNIGLTRSSLDGLAARSGGSRRFALDSYRRLLEMFGAIALGLPSDALEAHYEEARVDGFRLRAPEDVSEERLEEVVRALEDELCRVDGMGLPQDPREQLYRAISAVFRSWDAPRAKRYRESEGIADSLGTACTVQEMVFGNLSPRCGTGVLVSRNPTTGEPKLYGEYLPNAQGEDIVGGSRIPYSIARNGTAPGNEERSLEARHPDAYARLSEIARTLEAHFRDIQEIEFTIEEGELFFLQTRAAKRSARAAVRFAVDLVREGRIDKDEALMRVDAASLERLFRPTLEPPTALEARGIKPLARGLPASPGAAIGELVFDPDEAIIRAAEGREVILVRRETSPEDVHGMKAAAGILTRGGGMTSHAAVVARGLGKPSVVGCASVDIDTKSRLLHIGGVSLPEGSPITLDGTSGAIYEGALELSASGALQELDTLLTWADARRRLTLKVNTESPSKLALARALGASGVGLCRIEPLLFPEFRRNAIQRYFLSNEENAAKEALDALELGLRSDLEALFTVDPSIPYTIRLLDWPIENFLPNEPKEKSRLASSLGISEEALEQSISALREINPAIGRRGVRLNLLYPELASAQIRAIFNAAERSALEAPIEFLIPMISGPTELRLIRERIESEASGRAFRLGALIETPRACLLADRLAAYADFFSFGTNDLTQLVFGLSRDDASALWRDLLEEPSKHTQNPFATIDRAGLGTLIQRAIELGRSKKPDLVFGISGEHGADPASIHYAEELGIDFISCSPPRLPSARLSAAQAAILHKPT